MKIIVNDAYGLATGFTSGSRDPHDFAVNINLPGEWLNMTPENLGYLLGQPLKVTIKVKGIE